VAAHHHQLRRLGLLNQVAGGLITLDHAAHRYVG
jgi:hypothetical protein